MASNDLLGIAPLVSGALWFGAGLWPIVRGRLGSPFERAITAFALLLGLWSSLDWIFLGSTDAAFAVAISNVRITVITVAILFLLLAAKWIAAGHSRYDVLLVLPVLGSLAIVWTGLTSGVEWVSWGPRLIRDSFLYVLWASQQVAYVGAAIVFSTSVAREIRELPIRLRWPVLAIVASLFILLLSWLLTNIYNNVTQTPGIPWFSSLLAIPGVLLLSAMTTLTPETFGDVLRAASGLERRVVAVYLFHSSGDPLVALASGRTFAIEAEKMQAILSAVGGFVEKSMSALPTYAVTGLRFDEQGVLAVRGRHLIAAVVYLGPAYDAVRSELTRVVRDLEKRHSRDLETWESAVSIAEAGADALGKLLARPQ